METVDPRSVFAKAGSQEKPPDEPPAKLGKDIALLKKNIDPATGNSIADPAAQIQDLILKAINDTGVKSLEDFKSKLDSAETASWGSQLKVSRGQAPVITEEQIQNQRTQLKPTVANDRSASKTKPKVCDSISTLVNSPAAPTPHQRGSARKGKAAE